MNWQKFKLKNVPLNEVLLVKVERHKKIKYETAIFSVHGRGKVIGVVGGHFHFEMKILQFVSIQKLIDGDAEIVDLEDDVDCETEEIELSEIKNYKEIDNSLKDDINNNLIIFDEDDDGCNIEPVEIYDLTEKSSDSESSEESGDLDIDKKEDEEHF